jgi:hypothetical protein
MANMKPTVRTPARAARAVTQRSGTYSGKGMLTAELLVGFLIVLIRVVADYEVQENGTVKGKVLHPNGQYGPLPILVGLIGTFFVLSFIAASGGNKAKLAVVFGGTAVLALAVKSTAEIDTVASTIGNIGSIVVPGPDGTESSGASNPNTAVTIPTDGGAGSTGAIAPTGPVGSPTNPSTNITNLPGTNQGPPAPPATAPAAPAAPPTGTFAPAETSFGAAGRAASQFSNPQTGVIGRVGDFGKIISDTGAGALNGAQDSLRAVWNALGF